MGILDRVRQARETYRQDAMRRSTTQHLQNKLDLQDLKDQRAALEARQGVQQQLRAEQKSVRDLKHPLIANVREKFKQAGAAHLTKIKTNISKNRQAYTSFNTNQTIGNSPFAPGNAHLLTGSVKLMRRTPVKAKKVVITYK